MTSELKPCPHCGTPGEFRSDTYGDRKRWWTVCPNKGCEVGYKFFIQEHAAAAWNTRIHSPGVGGSGGGKEAGAAGVKASAPTDWTDDAICLSGLADRLEEESAAESDRGNDSAAAAWSCRAYEVRQIVSRMVRGNDGVVIPSVPTVRQSSNQRDEKE